MDRSEPERCARRMRLKSAAQFIISTKRLRSRQSLREFVAEGSTGLDRIAAIDPRQASRRIIWSAVLLGLLAITVYYIQEIIRERFRYGVGTTVQMLDDGEIHFPAVSFCNLNPVRKRALCEKQEFLIAQSYVEQEKLCGSVLGQDEFLKSLTILMANEDNVTYEDLGHSLEGMLVECFIKGEPCNRSEITEVMLLQGNYGRCFCVFCRTAKPVTFSRTDNPFEGFNMILRTQFEEYVPSTSAEGFMVLLHDPRAAPDDNTNGIFVAPRRTTYIAIQARRVFRLGAPYPSRCSDEWSVDKLPSWVDRRAILEEYTPELCFQICHSDILNQKCTGCLVSGANISLLAAMDASAFCARNMSCAEALLARKSTFECNCPQRCSETVISFDKSFADWTLDTGRTDNLVKVTMYFTTISREQVKEFPILLDLTALSLVGGFLNMFVGLSFLSMYEFIEIGLFIYMQYKSRFKPMQGVPNADQTAELEKSVESPNDENGTSRIPPEEEEEEDEESVSSALPN